MTSDQDKLIEAMECAGAAADRIIDKNAQLEEENLKLKVKVAKMHQVCVDAGGFVKCSCCGEYDFDTNMEMFKDQNGDFIYGCEGHCFHVLQTRYSKEYLAWAEDQRE
jgi:hypothetical protein